MTLTDREKEELAQLKSELVKSCPICSGTGIFKAKICSCLEKFQLEVKKTSAHVSKKHNKLTFDDLVSPDVQEAKKEVREYIENMKFYYDKGIGLYLWSRQSGTGKTALGCMILTEALKRGYSAYFTTLEECVNLTTGGWFDEEKQQEFVRRMIDTQFLLIDDLHGREVKTGKNNDLLYTRFTSLFKQRCDNMLPTIITSNLTIDDIRREYGERVYSSACESLKLVDCTGLDWREEVVSKTLHKKRGSKK